MKKRIFAILLMVVLAFSMFACGESDGSGSEQKTTESNAQNQATEEKKEEAKDDGIIDFEGETYRITYTRHEVGKDYEGNPCLIYYFNYTNNGEEASSAIVDAYIQCFQNGIECESAILMDDNKEINNSMKDIKPGVTIEVANAYLLEDMSEVTLEASELISFDDNKDVQTITLK